MGTALARSWLGAGHQLTVWNRTGSRARPDARRVAHRDGHGRARHRRSVGERRPHHGVSSNLAMVVAGNATLLRTAEEQGVSAELMTPYMDLMARRLADGHGDESDTAVIDLLVR
jgi:3-hydroxyisobutyrate dehydrogenase-like beta-hydroxyacid dehydrogenase